MSKEYLYSLWCNTESATQTVWSQTTPTVCPTDGGHSINTSSIKIIDSKYIDAPINSNNRRLAVYDYDTGLVGPIASGSVGQVLKFGTSGTIKAENAEHYQIHFMSDQQSGIQAKNTVYTAVTTFVFEGTDKTPQTTLKCVVYSPSRTISVRLTDLTNDDAIIFEKTGISASSKQVVTIDVVGSLPAGEAILELSISRGGGGGSNPFIYSAILE